MRAVFVMPVCFAACSALGTMHAMLALKNVSVHRRGSPVLQEASLAVGPKDALCIVGPAGSGKSTVVQLLLRMIDPDGGIVEVDGVPLTAVPPPVLQLYRRRVGVVFDKPVLLQHATIAENIALPLTLAGAPENIIRRNTDDLLTRFSLTNHANAFPCTVSSGQQAAAAFARAVAAAPIILLLDEPFAQMDDAHASVAAELVRTMHRNGTTVIACSRSPETAKVLGARVVELRQQTFHAAKASQAEQSHEQHRILEEEAPAQEEEQVPVHTRVKKSHGAAGKKIRVTSIGSQLPDREQ